MNIIRTFAAVLIAQDVIENISNVQKQLKKLAPDVKWVAPENFHVTMKFLGSIPEDKLPQIYEALSEAAKNHSSFEINISDVGAFPNPHRARVVWAGIDDGSKELISLAKSLEDAFEKIGFEREKKDFSAHVTIGRIKDARPPKGFAEVIEKAEAKDLGRCRVEKIAVMKSELMRGGPVYSVLKEINLD